MAEEDAVRDGTVQVLFEAPDYEAQESAEERSLRLGLIERVRRKVAEGTPFATLIPGLNLSWIDRPRMETNCFYTLSLALILQGSKHLLVGDRSWRYGTGSMLVTGMDMPTSYELLNVRPSAPFVSLSLKLDPALIAELLADASTGRDGGRDALAVGRMTRDMLEDFERLLRLLDRPEQIPPRAPGVIRDIHWLAIAGASGGMLRALFTPDSTGQRIRRVIRWLRENFREPVTVERMAEVAHMAPTTFHRHFKALTSLSPLQYQKRLRLYEAQQFLIRGEGDVNAAAYAVGYRSPQQFSRDYRRLFGEPPGRNARQKREALL